VPEPSIPLLHGQSVSALPTRSDVDLFCYGEGIIDLNAQVSDRAFYFCVAEQDLHRSQVTGAPVDYARLGSAKRVCAEDVRVQVDAGDPCGDQPGVLPRREGQVCLRLPANRNSPGLLPAVFT
jgi:hypothetical protein